MKHNITGLKRAEKLLAQAHHLVKVLTVPAYGNRTKRLNKVIRHARERVERRRLTMGAMYATERAKLYE